MARKHISKKVFLNKDGFHSIAAAGFTVESRIVEPSEEGNKKKYYAYASLVIQDCSNHISLDIDLNTKGEFENTLYKLDRLEEIIKLTREAVIETRQDMIEYLGDDYSEPENSFFIEGY